MVRIPDNFYVGFNMSRRSTYKPEVPRKGTEVTTNKANIENAYAILNRHDKRLSDLESTVVIAGGGGISLDDAEEIALMMMDAE